MATASLPSEHAIEHERMEMDIEIERAAETLNDRHRAAAAVRDAVPPRATAKEPEHRPHATPTTARHKS